MQRNKYIKQPHVSLSDQIIFHPFHGPLNASMHPHSVINARPLSLRFHHRIIRHLHLHSSFRHNRLQRQHHRIIHHLQLSSSSPHNRLQRQHIAFDATIHFSTNVTPCYHHFNAPVTSGSCLVPSSKRFHHHIIYHQALYSSYRHSQLQREHHSL